ncbi:MAG: hypothetical protein ACHQUC_07580 [Chlamydiales bacterium]
MLGFAPFVPVFAFLGFRDDQLVYDSMLKSIKPIEKKYQVYTVGTGLDGGSEGEGFRVLSITLERRGEKMKKEEARKLIVAVVDEFIVELNKDVKIKPYLKDFPLSYNNVEVTIVNYDDSGADVYNPFIESMTADSGNICYGILELNSNKYASREKETFEQASAIVKGVH